MREAIGVVVLERRPAAEDELDPRVLDHVVEPRRRRRAIGVRAAEVDDRHARIHVENAVERAVPARGRVPDLADDPRAGPLVVRGLREFAQEMRAEIARDIEPPAVDAVAQVRAHRALGAVPEMLAHLVALDMEVGQVRDVGPAAVTVRILRSDEEPRAVRTVLVAERRLERVVAAPHMVEDAVEHDLEPARVRVADEQPQVGARAVLGAHLEVVGRVVLVVRVREMHRIEIQHIRADLVDVAELAAHAREVAAPEVDLVAPHARALDEAPLLGRLVPRAQRPRRRVEAALRVEVGARREAVDEHLVDDGARAPVCLARLDAFTDLRQG